MTYGLETLALFELHQHKLQVCENNWIRRIAGVTRIERRRMKDLREEVGTKACIVGKLVKSRIKWAGHMVRMKDEQLPKKRDKEARRFQKTRKTTTKMGWLREERSEKGRGGRKVERKCQQQGAMEANYKSSRTSEWPVDQPHPLHKGIRGRTTSRSISFPPHPSLPFHLFMCVRVRRCESTCMNVRACVRIYSCLSDSSLACLRVALSTCLSVSLYYLPLVSVIGCDGFTPCPCR